MKRFTLLLLVCISLFLTGCDDTVKATTVDGILLSIEVYPGRINEIDGWKKLTFKDGRTVIVHYGPGDSLYLGHYQVIELNKKGMITEVKCKSFESLVKTDSYQAYDPSNTPLLVKRSDPSNAPLLAKARAKDAQLENE